MKVNKCSMYLDVLPTFDLFIDSTFLYVSRVFQQKNDVKRVISTFFYVNKDLQQKTMPNFINSTFLYLNKDFDKNRYQPLLDPSFLLVWVFEWCLILFVAYLSSVFVTREGQSWFRPSISSPSNAKCPSKKVFWSTIECRLIQTPDLICLITSFLIPIIFHVSEQYFGWSKN